MREIAFGGFPRFRSLRRCIGEIDGSIREFVRSLGDCLISEIKRIAAATASRRITRRGDFIVAIRTRILDGGKGRVASSGYTEYIGSPDIASRLIPLPGFVRLRSRFCSGAGGSVLLLTASRMFLSVQLRFHESLSSRRASFRHSHSRVPHRGRETRGGSGISAALGFGREDLRFSTENRPRYSRHLSRFIAVFIAAPLWCVLTRYSDA